MAIAAKKDGPVEIAAANIVQATILIQGTSPLVQCKFSMKARTLLMDSMSTPANERRGKSKAARPPRNYDDDFLGAQHRMAPEIWGVPSVAFKAAMIRACKAVAMVMTDVKIALWVVADGNDMDDGTPLTRLIVDAPERLESPVRNQSGVADIRIRPMWRDWAANVTLQFDADMITPRSVVNLLDRAGRQVGIGEGRQFSKDSVGQGWGSFTVVSEDGQ